MADKIRQRGLNVTLTGFVDDIRPYVAQSHVYVIPLFVGSGTRIKAFEAMAMGRPVISTSLGIEGLDVTDGEHFLRADNAEAFSRGILALLDDAALRSRMAGAARQPDGATVSPGKMSRPSLRRSVWTRWKGGVAHGQAPTSATTDTSSPVGSKRLQPSH